MTCLKDRCLKQINPKYPDVYFGIPFEKDENRMACYLCGLEVRKSKLLRRTTPIEEDTKQSQKEGYLELFKLLTESRED